MRVCLVTWVLVLALGVGGGRLRDAACPSTPLSAQSFSPSNIYLLLSDFSNSSLSSAIQGNCGRSPSSPPIFSLTPPIPPPFPITPSYSDTSVTSDSQATIPSLGAVKSRNRGIASGREKSEGSQANKSETGDLAELALELELVWCLVVIAVALGLGFKLGARNVHPVSKPLVSDPFDPCKSAVTQISTAVESPETLQAEEQDCSRKGSFSDFTLNSCPTPSVAGLSDDVGDLSVRREEAALHIENGRLKSTFRDLQLVWRDCVFKYYTAVHLLEEKKYILKEVTLTLTSLSEVKRHQVFQDIQAKAKCGSRYVIRYITCWLEEAEGAPNALPRVRIFVQIEYFSLTSLADFLIQKGRPSRSDICVIFRQVLKGVCHLHKENLTFYDLSLSKIYVDEQLNLKIADFELAPALKTCRSLTLDRLDEEESVSPSRLWHKRNMRSLGLLLYQLMGGDREGLRDLAQENTLPEDFTNQHEAEAGLILWMVRQTGPRPEAVELMRSREFQRWSETVGVNSPGMKAGLSPLLAMPMISLTKID